jgi:hypothetical protein
MWRETPYVIIGAHEPGRENKLVMVGEGGILGHGMQVDILERDPDTGKATGADMRICFTRTELMRKFAETLIEAAERWEKRHADDRHPADAES